MESTGFNTGLGVLFKSVYEAWKEGQNRNEMQLGRKDIYGIGQNECEMPEEISKKPLIQTTNSNVESGWGNTDLELNLQNCNQKQKENYPKAKIKKGQEQSLKQTLWRITGRKKKASTWVSLALTFHPNSSSLTTAFSIYKKERKKSWSYLGDYPFVQ